MEIMPQIIHESWHEYLQPLFDDPKMSLIRYKVLPGQKFYPLPENIFRVFSMPIQDIKVVILGQDPYPNGEAIGYAFAVDENTKIPASLKIISGEVAISDSKNYETNSWKTLQHWINQGVFLLNTALTVEAKNPNSHTGYWKWFTRSVVEAISRVSNPIWLLWGSKAQEYRTEIYKGNEMAEVLLAPHPASELYSNGKTTFRGSNHFNKTNELLVKRNKQIIYW